MFWLGFGIGAAAGFGLAVALYLVLDFIPYIATH